MIRHLGSVCPASRQTATFAGARTGRTRFITHAKVMFTHWTISVYKVPRVPSPSPPSRRGRVSTGSPAGHPRNQAKRRGPTETFLFLVACCLLWPSIATAQVREVRRVLFFTEGNLSSPAVAAAEQEIRAGLEKSPLRLSVIASTRRPSCFLVGPPIVSFVRGIKIASQT